jgi:hypothetical protein
VSDPAAHHEDLPARPPKLPSERDWARAAVLEPRPAPRHPQLISDGAGLPFALSALAGPPAPLDPQDAAVAGLLAYLNERATPKRAARAPWKRGAPPPSPPAAPVSLEGWRELVRTDDEVLFAHGLPPQLAMVTLKQRSHRRAWTVAGSSVPRSLRATRDGIRASSWRPDPTRELTEADSELRLLVTEQAFASGQSADGRVLVPDIYEDDGEVVLRVFVSPRPGGFQTGTRNPETPVRIALPRALGPRLLLDGAIAYAAPVEAAEPDQE